MRLSVLPLLTLASVSFVATMARAQAPGTDVFVADFRAANGTISIGTPRNVTQRAGYDNQPAFTADGSAILFTSQRDGQTDIWRVALADGKASALFSTPESEYSATLLRDGTGISVIRVERDSTQRLWRFPFDGSSPSVVLERIKPVGYHTWTSDSTIVIYVLGRPNTLQRAETRGGTSVVLARNVGRSIARIPRTSEVSFVQFPAPDDAATGAVAHVMAIEPVSGTMHDIAPIPAGGEFFAWTADGTLLAGVGSHIVQWEPLARRWSEVASFAGLGLRDVSRLALSADGTKIAFVAADAR